MMGKLFGLRARWTVSSQAGPAPLRGDGESVAAGAPFLVTTADDNGDNLNRHTGIAAAGYR